MVHDFGIFGEKYGFLTIRGNKIKYGPYIHELLDEKLLPAALATFKILGDSKLDSLEAKGNHHADVSARNAALKESNSSQTSPMAQRCISTNANKNLGTEMSNWPQKRKNRTRNSTISGLIKTESSGLDQVSLSPNGDSKIPNPHFYTYIKSSVC